MRGLRGMLRGWRRDGSAKEEAFMSSLAADSEKRIERKALGIRSLGVVLNTLQSKLGFVHL